MSVDASPSSIPADGRSYAQILVTVVDEEGRPARDNTEVRLTATAGDITPVVYSSGGRAVGVLTSSTSPQTAVVHAIADGAIGSIDVQFFASDYEEASASARTIRMTGGSLAFSVDEDTVLGSNGVELEYRGLTIRATSVQVCQSNSQLRAQGDVTVSREDRSLTADALTCDLRYDRISLLEMGDEPRSHMFDTAKLEEIGQSAMADTGQFEPLINVEGRSWIVCERLVIIPGHKVLFFKASIYVGDSRVISVPYYSYSYETRESILQQVRYDSSDGMLIDLPFYYRMTDSGAGAFKFRYAAEGSEMGSYFRPRKGLSMGLEQDYALGDRSQGRLFVDSILSSKLAFELAHHIEYGSALMGGRADFSARYQPTSSYGRDIYNAALNVTGSLRAYSYSLNAYFGGSSYPQYDYLDPESVYYDQQSTTSVRAVIRPRAPMGAGLLSRLSPSLTIGYGSLWDSADEELSTGLYQTLGFGFSRSRSGRGRTSTGFDGSLALTSTASGDTGAYLQLRPNLRTRWKGGSASLSYTLNLHGGTTDTYSSLSTHQLGCNLSIYGDGRWNLHSSVHYGLDTNRLNLFSSLRYRIADDWTIRSSYNLYSYSYSLNDVRRSYRNSYLKVGIYRPIGIYEIGLAWSPDGQYYGVHKNRHLWLELGGTGF